mgnify:CR=1 FL=1
MSSKFIKINKKINNFNKIIEVDGDKSLSIRWALLASQAIGNSKAFNLLRSEDTLNALKCLKKLGVKIKLSKKFCQIEGRGINGFLFKKNITLNAGNSGTLGRLLLPLLIKSPYKIKMVGDKSLSKRDFYRVIKPLKQFGAKFKSKSGKLPIVIKGTNLPRPIKYNETKGSAQCKSAIMLAALNTRGETIIKAKESRNHSELLFKYLNLPVKIKKKKNYDEIKVSKVKNIKTINYNIPSDISSSAFFLTLTALSKNSKLVIKKVNINPSRIGIITILKRMGIKIFFQNKKTYKGEKIADIKVEGGKKLIAINCPTKFNSSAIDEFLIIFILAAKAKGVSYFKDLAELDQKESPRLQWGSKILNLMGVKNIVTKDSIKIFGNPDFEVRKKIIIKDYLKDHRVFMTCVVAGLSFGGEWHIHDKDSIKTSFPNFLKIINQLKA